MDLEFYGVRGSAPAYRNKGTSYGVNTSCVLLRAADKTIVFDGGTGAFELGDVLGKERGEIDLLLSHVHIDHVQGLPFFAPLLEPGRVVNVYSEERLGMDIKAQLDMFTASPLWPIRISAFPADIRYITLKRGESFTLGKNVRVDTTRSNHPDISTMFRVSAEGRTVVYALDYEHECEDMTLIKDFARGADLTIFDATYSDAEYPSKMGWGHSTWEKGLALALSGECGRVALTHISHTSTDAQLERIEQALEVSGGRCVLAREGMRLEV